MPNLDQKQVKDIAEEFANLQSKNEMAEVLHELFDKGKIYLMTDLSKDEIRLLTRMYMIAKMKKKPSWITGINFYCQLMLSKDRKSRQEILRAISGYNQQNILQKMNPFNRNKF